MSKRIAIVGAGAIGGWLGIKLAAAGYPVSVLARGSTLEALRARPWRLETSDGVIDAQVKASDRLEELGVHDVVILAVKGPAVGEVAPLARALLSDDGIVLPAINGVPWWFTALPAGMLPPVQLRNVDRDGRIAAELPVGNVVGAVAHVSARVEASGRVRQIAGNGLIIGEPTNDVSNRVLEVSNIFAAAGIDVAVSDRIRRDVWYKLWGNMTINPISALTGSTADRILDEPLVEALICAVMEEARQIGDAIGCDITESAKARNTLTRKLGAFKPSMLQDLEAGRPLEIAALLEAPREIGQLLGLSTPAMDGLLGLARLLAQERGRQYAGLN